MNTPYARLNALKQFQAVTNLLLIANELAAQTHHNVEPSLTSPVQSQPIRDDMEVNIYMSWGIHEDMAEEGTRAEIQHINNDHLGQHGHAPSASSPLPIYCGNNHHIHEHDNSRNIIGRRNSIYNQGTVETINTNTHFRRAGNQSFTHLHFLYSQ